MTGTVAGEWPGDEEERTALLEAISRNCSCAVDGFGVRTSTCAAHEMLLNDRGLKRLISVRREEAQRHTYEKGEMVPDWARSDRDDKAA